MDGHIEYQGRNVWRITASELHPDEDFALNWGRVIPPSLGTRHQRHVLLSSAKELYIAICGPSNPRQRLYSPLTLRLNFIRLRALIRWMVERGVWRFSDIDPDHLIDFFSQIKARSNLFPSESTVAQWIYDFELMWELRGSYLHSIHIDVSTLENEILTRVKTRAKRPWSALEDDVALGLINEGLGWIERFGGFIRDVVHAAWRESKTSVGLTRWERKKRSKEFYRSIEASQDYRQLRDSLSTRRSVHQTLGIALSLTEGACVFLLLTLVGLRVSELLALNANAVVTDRQDGRPPTTYLSGPAAKKRGMTRRWVAGDPIPGIVEYLLSLTSFESRESRRTGPLLLQRPAGAPMFLSGRRPRRWSRSCLVRRLSLFAVKGQRLNGVRATSIHPHMLRKTFAQLAVKRDKSRLEPVAAQLGHAYSSFTDDCYVRPDHELYRLLAEQDRIELARGLEQLLSCENLGGKAAPAVRQIRERARTFRGRKSLTSLVDDLIAHGVQLAPCDWGYCVYSKVYSACSGDDRGPNPAYRSPDVCAGCANFTVAAEHRPWWEERVRAEEAFLSHSDLPEQTRVLVEGRVRKSRNVLAGLIKMPKRLMTDEEN
jgi:integrase